MPTVYTVQVHYSDTTSQLRWSHANEKTAREFFGQLSRAYFYDGEAQINLGKETPGQDIVRLALYDKRTGVLVDFTKGEDVQKIVDEKRRLGLLDLGEEGSFLDGVEASPEYVAQARAILDGKE